jgi:hypothetical protein
MQSDNARKRGGGFEEKRWHSEKSQKFLSHLFKCEVESKSEIASG